MKRRLTKVLLGFWIFILFILFIVGWGERGYFISKEVSWKAHYDDLFNEHVEAGSTVLSPVLDIYPFESSSIEYFDITEFLMFGVTPVLLYLSIIYVRGKKENNL